MSSIIDRLLPLCGFELHRSRKHEVYRRDDGKQFFRSKTPSDWRAERKQISDLCHVLGMSKAQALQLLDRRGRKERADEPEEQAFATNITIPTEVVSGIPVDYWNGTLWPEMLEVFRRQWRDRAL